jgi:CheY-like chemotaxis protein
MQSSSILVVDDEPVLTFTLEKALASEGFDVLVANDGAEAVDIVKARCPSIVVVDLHMPIMDGYAFIDACRAVAECANVPIIVATGSNDLADVQRRTAGKGLVRFMAKPYDLDTLLTLVRDLLHTPTRH